MACTLVYQFSQPQCKSTSFLPVQTYPHVIWRVLRHSKPGEGSCFSAQYKPSEDDIGLSKTIYIALYIW